MNQPFRRRIDIILDTAYLEGLGDRTVDEVRAMHEKCLEVETEVSYVRRLAQARIDIITAELDRRRAGGTLGDLIAALPQVLADEGSRPDPVHSRLPRHLAPAPEIPWRRGLERLIADATLVNLPTLSDDELRATLADLETLEAEVSQRRRGMHQVMDAIEADLAERHKVGKA